MRTKFFFLLLFSVFFVLPVDAQDNFQKNYNQGLRLVNEQKYKDSRVFFLKALEYSSNSALGNYAYGRSNLYDDGDLLLAIKYLKKATDCDLHFGKAYFYLGLAYLLKSDYQNAGAAFLRAYEEDPSCLAALVNLGYVYDYLGNEYSAQVWYKKYLIEKDRTESSNDFLF